MYDIELYENLRKLSNVCGRVGISLEDAARFMAELPIGLITVSKEVDIKMEKIEIENERWDWLDDTDS